MEGNFFREFEDNVSGSHIQSQVDCLRSRMVLMSLVHTGQTQRACTI